MTDNPIYCDECIFWLHFYEEGSEHIGSCRRHAPITISASKYWPRTTKFTWCGDGKKLFVPDVGYLHGPQDDNPPPVPDEKEK